MQEAARVALVLEQYPMLTPVTLDGAREPRRRAGAQGAHRHSFCSSGTASCASIAAASWERLAGHLTTVDLSADLHSYEERRERDRRALETMIEYAQTARCRTRYILEYFGEEVDAGWRCHHCDACDAIDAWTNVPSGRDRERLATRTA